MRLFRSLSLVVMACLWCVSADAGDFAKVRVMGASVSGDIVAIEQYGILDGSGAPYSEIHFVDVAKNAYAAPVVKAGGGEVEDIDARKIAQQQAAATIRKLGIQEKVFPYAHVLQHKKTDLGVDPHRAHFAREVYSMFQEGDWLLELKTHPSKSKMCADFEVEGLLLDVTLTDKKTGKTAVLQKDKRLPKSRRCPTGYRIQDVYLGADRLFVVVSMTLLPGFEGPDLRYLIVGGRLPE